MYFVLVNNYLRNAILLAVFLTFTNRFHSQRILFWPIKLTESSRANELCHLFSLLIYNDHIRFVAKMAI